MENINETMYEDTYISTMGEQKKDTMGLINKFCWPGFVMPQFWGIANGLWITILIWMCPILIILMSFKYGCSGYKLAYENCLKSKKKFYDKQVRWQKAAIIYTGFLILLIFIWIFYSYIKK